MKATITLFSIVTISLVLPMAAGASAPTFIPLQGFLEDADGTPVSGDLNIHFAVYDAEVGGTALWYETQSISVEEGLFTAYLGEVEAINLAMFRDRTNLWLAVQVESDPEMERVFLGSTPFTGYAEYCGNIPDHGHDLAQISGTDGLVMGAQSCTGGDKVVGINISGSLVCASDENTTYLAGSGLFLAGVTFSVDTTVVQSRVSADCSTGSSIRQINADGTVVCEADDDTTYSGADFIQNQTSVVQTAGFNIDGNAYVGGNIGIGTTSPGAKLDVAGAVRATDYRLTACSDRVRLAAARTYTTLNSELDADYTGAGVCGGGWHVCNYQESTVYGVVFGCDLGGASPWIVGGFSNWEPHRRSIWNGQDSVQCGAGNYPSWWGRWGPYTGRIHCEAGANSKQVACCKNM